MVHIWNVKYNNIHCAANMMSGLKEYHVSMLSYNCWTEPSLSFDLLYVGRSEAEETFVRTALSCLAFLHNEIKGQQAMKLYHYLCESDPVPASIKAKALQSVITIFKMKSTKWNGEVDSRLIPHVIATSGISITYGVSKPFIIRILWPP